MMTNTPPVAGVVIQCSRWNIILINYSDPSNKIDVTEGQTILASALCTMLQCNNPYPTDREVTVIDITYSQHSALLPR